MIEKQPKKRPASAYKAIDYHEKKVEKGDAERLFSTIDFENTKDAARQFDFLRDHSKRKIEKPMFAVSLNLSPGETLSNEVWTEIGKEYMAKMGFDNSPFIIYRHYDKQYEHIHLITTVYTYDPLKIEKLQFSKLKANKIIAEFEERYSLKRVTSKSLEKPKETVFVGGLKEDRGQEAKYLKYPLKRLKTEIRDKIAYAFSHTKDIIQASEYLYRNGIEVQLSTNKSGISGISFKLIQPAIRDVRFSTLPSYYGKHKLSEKESERLNDGEVVALGKMKVMPTDNKMVVSVERDEQLKRSIQEGLMFKGSSLDKQLSWNVLKKHFDIENWEKVVETMDRREARPKSKLLTSIESQYLHGIYEAIQEGERLKDIWSKGLDTDTYYWQKALEIERNRQNRLNQEMMKEAKRLFKEHLAPAEKVLSVLNDVLKSERIGETELVNLLTIGIDVRNTGEFQIIDNSARSFFESKEISKKYYQLLNSKSIDLRLTEDLKRFLNSVRLQNKDQFKKEYRNDKGHYKALAIVYKNFPEHRAFITSSINELRNQNTLSPSEARKLIYAIQRNISGDLQDENTLKRD